MITSLILPGPGFGTPRRRSSLILHWRASDLSLNAITGQVGSFTRASAGTAFDSNGIRYDGAQQQPRFTVLDLDGDGIPDTPALLLEGARTNLVVNDDLSAWTLSGATPSLNIGENADGTSLIDAVVETATTGEHFADYVTAGIADNTVVTDTVEVRPYSTGGPVRNVAVFCVLKDNATVIGAIVNPGNGAVLATSGAISASVEQVLGVPFCYRVSVTYSVGAGAFSPRMRIQCTAGAGGTDVVYAGNVGSGIAVGGMQREAAQFASSKIVGGVGASRVADLFTLDASGILPESTWTMYLKAVARASRNAADYFVQVGTADPGVVIAADNSTGGNYITGRFNDATSTAFDSLVASPPSTGDLFEAAVQYTAVPYGVGQTTLAYALNGGAQVAGAPSPSFGPPSAWGGTNVVALSGRPGAEGYHALIALKVAPGARTLDQMRSAY